MKASLFFPSYWSGRANQLMAPHYRMLVASTLPWRRKQCWEGALYSCLGNTLICEGEGLADWWVKCQCLIAYLETKPSDSSFKNYTWTLTTMSRHKSFLKTTRWDHPKAFNTHTKYFVFITTEMSATHLTTNHWWWVRICDRSLFNFRSEAFKVRHSKP